MALDVSPQALWEEATEAIDYAKRRVAAVDELIRGYQTPWHVGSADRDALMGTSRYDPRNQSFEFIAQTIAQTVFDNPRWQVTADRGYAAQVDAPALQAGMNKWTRDSRLRKLLSRLYVDYAFHSCNSIVTLEDVKPSGYGKRSKAGEHQTPKLRRIGMKRAFRDHRCFDPEDSRYTGHIYIMDKSDLMKSDEWEHSIVRKMAEGSGVREVRDGEDLPTLRERGEVALFDLWVPEYTLPDKDKAWDGIPEDRRSCYNGTIFTLPLLGFDGADNKNIQFPRAPRPAYCSKHGPYQFGGTYPVPDDVVPLSQLIATYGQSKQNNDVWRALYEAIIDYKTIIMTSGTDATLAGKVKRAKHSGVVTTNLQDVARMIARIELGGPTPALLTGAQLTQQTADRAIGTSEAIRGNVTGDATAFENSLAATGASMRQAFPKQQFIDYVGEIGFEAAYLMYMTDTVRIDLDGGAGAMLGGNPAAHATEIYDRLSQSGVRDDVIEAYIAYAEEMHRSTPFEAFGFNVQPMSTERASDPANRARLGVVLPQAVQLMQLGPQMPWMNTKEILGWVGQAFDLPDLARVYDEQTAAKAGAAMAQQQMQDGQSSMPSKPAAAGSTATTGQPRLGGDIGSPPAAIGPKQSTAAAVRPQKPQKIGAA